MSPDLESAAVACGSDDLCASAGNLALGSPAASGSDSAESPLSSVWAGDGAGGDGRSDAVDQRDETMTDAELARVIAEKQREACMHGIEIGWATHWDTFPQGTDEGEWKKKIAAERYPYPVVTVPREVKGPSGIKYRIRDGKLEVIRLGHSTWERDCWVQLADLDVVSELRQHPTEERR